jgi:site-specific DNA-methyltransferase (adenine-specific)
MTMIELNRIYNEDCLEGMRKIPDETVDLIVTDPPYKTITGGDSNGKNSIRPKGILSGNRKLFKYQTNISICNWMPELFRVLKQGTHCYVFSNVLNLKEMIEEGERAGFKLQNLLVWEKNNCTPSQYYMKNCEYVLMLRKGRAKWINDIGGSKTVHRYENIIGNKTHPAEKPVPLIEFYINNSTNEGDIVLDPFMGSGATAIACINTNRNYIGFEIDKHYCDIANERIKKALAEKVVSE